MVCSWKDLYVWCRTSHASQTAAAPSPTGSRPGKSRLAFHKHSTENGRLYLYLYRLQSNKNQGENVQWTCGFCDRSCVLLSVFLSIYAIKYDVHDPFRIQHASGAFLASNPVRKGNGNACVRVRPSKSTYVHWDVFPPEHLSLRFHRQTARSRWRHYCT